MFLLDQEKIQVFEHKQLYKIVEEVSHKANQEMDQQEFREWAEELRL